MLCHALCIVHQSLQYRMSSVMLNTLGKEFIYLPLEMSPTGATTNGNCLYLHLPNGQESVVEYDDSSCNLGNDDLNSHE